MTRVITYIDGFNLYFGLKNKGWRRYYWLDLVALATLPDFHIHYGHYLKKQRQCRKCGTRWMDYEEKMTDVNIAVQLLADAFDDRFDTALVISADSDLTTPVQYIRARFPHKRVIVAQPPGRNSVQLAKAGTAAFTLSKTKVRQNQLPDTIATLAGYVLKRPAHWK